jgi:adenylate kinase family enzyme
MPLIYITGLAGSGKTTVCKELVRRGFEAHDADSEGFNKWQNKESGEIVEVYDKDKGNLEDWYKKYSWSTIRSKVEELANKATNKLIFICGVSANEETVWDLYTKVICLNIDESTLRDRITSRTTNNFGKEPYEFEMLLKWHKSYLGEYLKKGALVVNANRPLDNVVDDILKNCI